MASVLQAPGMNENLEALGVSGVEEPVLIQYEAQVWSCKERKEIPARLYYSITNEQNRRTFRLLFVEPLI